MELSNENIANAIAETTHAEVRTFYSCHNLTAREFAGSGDLSEHDEKECRDIEWCLPELNGIDTM